ITSTGATGSPQVINATLTIVQPQTFTASPTTLNFSYSTGSSTTPPTQTVQLTAGAPAPFTASATTTSNGNWLSVTASNNNTTPSTLTVAVNVTGLAPGNYTGAIAINSTSATTQPAASITVNLTVVSVPKPLISAIQNAASAISGPLSPGENIVIYGSG